MRQSQSFRQRLGNQRSLVVPPLSFSFAMQRYRHHHVRRQRGSFSTHQFGQPLRKPRPQRLNLLEFQQQNRPHHRFLIQRKATGPFEGVSSVLASRAEQRLPLLLRHSSQRPSANLAHDVGHPFERRQALLTDRNPARARQQPLADAAAGRKKQADDSVTDLTLLCALIKVEIYAGVISSNCGCH